MYGLHYNHQKEFKEKKFKEWSKRSRELRDINTIYSNFVIIEQQELKNVNCMQAYSLYLMLLILKYKYIEIFNKIFITNNYNINDEEILSHYSKRKNSYFEEILFKL